MKRPLQPHEEGFDLEFLTQRLRWGLDSSGHRRCCVKTIKKDGVWPARFGTIYADEPLRVQGIHRYNERTGDPVSYDSEVFTSLEELVKIWMVD